MQLKVIEAHTMGEPLRLVTEGFPDIKGNLLEPYGHKDMFGAILTSKVHDEADLGVLFMNTQGMEGSLSCRERLMKRQIILIA